MRFCHWQFAESAEYSIRQVVTDLSRFQGLKRNQEVLMGLEAHLAEIETRHRALDKKIEQVRLHPSVDPLELARLKREKLRLKDELAKLQTDRR